MGPEKHSARASVVISFLVERNKLTRLLLVKCQMQAIFMMCVVAAIEPCER